MVYSIANCEVNHLELVTLIKWGPVLLTRTILSISNSIYSMSQTCSSKWKGIVTMSYLCHVGIDSSEYDGESNRKNEQSYLTYSNGPISNPFLL